MFKAQSYSSTNPYWFTLWLWTSLYGSRSVRLQDLDFDRKQLKVVQGKGKKDHVPLSIHLIEDYKNTSKLKTPKITFSTASLS
jgi:integrase